MEGSHEELTKWALGMLAAARAEAAEGYLTGDALMVRRGAERAWKAAGAATDAAMAARGIPRNGTTADRVRHYEFLDSLDGGDLSKRYSVFTDRLHHLCAQAGHLPPEPTMSRLLDEVEAFMRAVALTA